MAQLQAEAQTLGKAPRKPMPGQGPPPLWRRRSAWPALPAGCHRSSPGAAPSCLPGPATWLLCLHHSLPQWSTCSASSPELGPGGQGTAQRLPDKTAVRRGFRSRAQGGLWFWLFLQLWVTLPSQAGAHLHSEILGDIYLHLRSQKEQTPVLLPRTFQSQSGPLPALGLALTYRKRPP